MIPVLDKGYIKLVDHMGTDLSIVRSARWTYNGCYSVSCSFTMYGHRRNI